jgi:hypothetical protein
MLSEALQRNAKHEARLSNISDYSSAASKGNCQRFFSRDCGIRMTIILNAMLESLQRYGEPWR